MWCCLWRFESDKIGFSALFELFVKGSTTPPAPQRQDDHAGIATYFRVADDLMPACGRFLVRLIWVEKSAVPVERMVYFRYPSLTVWLFSSNQSTQNL
jgi:hypothetical protein